VPQLPEPTAPQQYPVNPDGIAGQARNDSLRHSTAASNKVKIIAAVIAACVVIALIFALTLPGTEAPDSNTDSTPDETSVLDNSDIPDNDDDVLAALDNHDMDILVPDNTVEPIEREIPALQKPVTDVPIVEVPEIQEPEPQPPAPVFTSAHASAVLVSQNDIRYDPELVMDGRPDTAWAFAGSGGQWIELRADTDQYVSGIRIMNGYNKFSDNLNDWLYYPNNRPSDIEIIFSDGSSIPFLLDDVFNSRNHIFQDLRFGEVIKTSTIRIFIHEVYHGSRWDDTCISEIKVY